MSLSSLALGPRDERSLALSTSRLACFTVGLLLFGSRKLMLLDAIIHDEVLIEVKRLHGSLLNWNLSQRHLTLAIMLV